MGSWRWETQGWMGWGSPFSLGLGSWLWGAYGAEVPLWGREANGGWAWGRSAPIWGSYGAGLSWLPPGGGGQGGLGPWLWGAYGAVVPLLRPRGREANGGWAWGRSAPHVGQLWGRAQQGGGQGGLGSGCLTWGAAVGYGVLFGVVAMGDPRVDGFGVAEPTYGVAMEQGVCWGRGSPSSPGLGPWLWGTYGAEVSLWGWEPNGGWAWGRSAPIWGSYGAGLSRVPLGGSRVWGR